MKKTSMYVMSFLYAVAGVYHFVHPEFYRRIMPPWLPWHNALIAISGVCEILFAALLPYPKTRRLAAWCIIALLVAVYPANIQMFMNYSRENNPLLWITVARLPLQFVLIWWAYQYTKPAAVRK